MSDSNQVTKKGVSWHLIMKITAWAMPVILAGLLAYFRTTFAAREELVSLDNRITDHIGDNQVRIHSLEEFRARSESSQSLINETLQTIIKEQSAQRGVLEAVRNGQDRIFNRLDTLSDRDIKQSNK